MLRDVRSPLACASLTLLLAAGCQRPTPPVAGVRDAGFVAAVNHGVAQMGQYDFPAAVDTFAALAATHPGEAGVILDLALARINRQRDGDAAEAERALGRIVGDAAVGTRAQYALGLLRLYAGREAAAAPLLDAVAPSHAIPIRPTSPARRD
jgi:hypothetical protein